MTTQQSPEELLEDHECTQEDMEAYMLWCKAWNEAAEAQHTQENWNAHFANIATRTKQRWKVREDGDTTRTQEIVHRGQQTIKRV